jgi:hypothetical protein
VLDGMAGHPKHILMLTADAFGVLPPIAKLTPEQAKYHFISGYTAKVAGTERGVKEPQATFSACFGAPFMPLHPTVYADLLGKKIDRHDVAVWLVGTGWTGGPYGVGERFRISTSRAVIRAAINGDLDDVDYVTDPFFRFAVPTSCPDVAPDLLDPRSTWADPSEYGVKARELAALFTAKFTAYAALAGSAVASSGPQPWNRAAREHDRTPTRPPRDRRPHRVPSHLILRPRGKALERGWSGGWALGAIGATSSDRECPWVARRSGACVVGDAFVTVGVVVRLDVDRGRDRGREPMVERVLDFVSDVMSLTYREVGGDGDRRLDAQLVSMPSHSEVLHGLDTCHVNDGLGGVVDDIGLDAVRQATHHAPRRAREQPQDRKGDEQPGHRIDP